LYFDKIQAALLNESPDDEDMRLREAALESVRSDSGIHQLIPYFVNFVSNQVTHRLDDTFVLRQMMELTAAIIANPALFLDPYAAPLSAPVLTCLMSRKLGGGGAGGGADATVGSDAVQDQYELRQLAASLLGDIARKYGRTNTLLRPKLTRTCLKAFLDPTKSAPVLFGAVSGLSAAGGPEAVRVLVLPTLKPFDAAVLQALHDRAGPTSPDFQLLVGGIVKAIWTLAPRDAAEAVNGINGAAADAERAELIEFLGPIIGTEVARLGNHQLNKAVLEARHIE